MNIMDKLRRKAVTAEDPTEICCLAEDDALAAEAEDCCVEAHKAADEAILAEGHPRSADFFPGDDEWRSLDADQREELARNFRAAVDRYHAAFEAVNGYACTHCCGGGY